VSKKRSQSGHSLGKTRSSSNRGIRPAWLAKVHADLDAAVAAAYGWPADITEGDALARLLDLNHHRARPMAADFPAAVCSSSPP
jgi:hypothetical protein